MRTRLLQFVLSTAALVPVASLVVPAARAADATTLTLWNGFAAPENKALVEMIAAYWTPTHPNIKIEVQGEKDVQAVLTALSGGEPPDVVMAGDSESPALWNRNGALEDLTAVVAPIKDELNAKVVPAALGWCHQGDQWFALPFVDYNWGLFYNKAMFRAAGLDPEKPPQTADELAADAEKLTKVENGEIVQLGWVPTRDEWSTINFGMVFGAKFIDAKGMPTLDSPGLKAMFDWDVKLENKVGREKVQAFISGFTKGDNPFKLGKVAMYLDGSWQAAMLKDAAGLDYGVAPLPPSDPAYVRANDVGTNPIVIPKGGHNKAAAMEFATFMALNPQIAAQFSDKIANLPHLKAELATFTSDPKVKLFADLSNAPNAGAWAPVPYARRYADELATLVGEIHGRGTPVAEALAASQQAIAGEAKAEAPQ